MANFRDLIGKTFGRLTALTFRTGSFWRCQCVCGNLSSAHTTSCGCYGKERRKAGATKHGLSDTKGYIAFKARERLERKRKFDAAWTLEMELALVALQPLCVICGAPAAHTDHVRPLSRGHGLIPGNAVRLCQSCNCSKHAKLLEDLHPEIREPLVKAAEAFKVHWDSVTLKEETKQPFLPF